MTNRRFSETATVIAIAALALTMFAPGAMAQAKRFNVEIPFEFYAGGRLMPAGSYSIEQDTINRTTQIHDRNGHIATVLSQASVNRVAGNNRLVFNRYGNMAFLSELQWAQLGTGYKVKESKLERETKLGTAPTRVAVQPRQ